MRKWAFFGALPVSNRLQNKASIKVKCDNISTLYTRKKRAVRGSDLSQTQNTKMTYFLLLLILLLLNFFPTAKEGERRERERAAPVWIDKCFVGVIASTAARHVVIKSQKWWINCFSLLFKQVYLSHPLKNVSFCLSKQKPKISEKNWIYFFAGCFHKLIFDEAHSVSCINQ